MALITLSRRFRLVPTEQASEEEACWTPSTSSARTTVSGVSWDGEVDWVPLRPKQAAIGSILLAERRISWAKEMYAAHYFRLKTVTHGGHGPAF